MRRQLSARVWPGSCRRIAVRLAFCGLFPATLFDAGRAGAVRPFVTDDARIVNKGQLETESFAGMTFSSGGRPGYHLGALQGFSPTDWMEIIAGGAGCVRRDLSGSRDACSSVEPRDSDRRAVPARALSKTVRQTPGWLSRRPMEHAPTRLTPVIPAAAGRLRDPCRVRVR